MPMPQILMTPQRWHTVMQSVHFELSATVKLTLLHQVKNSKLQKAVQKEQLEMNIFFLRSVNFIFYIPEQVETDTVHEKILSL